MDLVAVFQVDGGAAGIFQRPVVVPIEEDAHLGWAVRPEEGGPEGLELGAQLGNFFKDPGFAAAGVADDRPVELFAAAFGAAQLEELDGVGAVGDGLVALGPHLAGALEGVVGLPVLLAGGLFHQHEGLALQPAHQVVAHGGVAPGGVVGRVVVPADDVHLFGPLEVVQPLIGAHQVGGDGGGGVVFADDVPFQLVVFQQAVGEEAVVINRDAGEVGLPQAAEVHPFREGIRGDDLVPVVEGVAPELGVPGFVYGFQRPVFPAQPDPEGLFAVFAVAAGVVLVADMPADDVGVAGVAAGQLFHQPAGELLVDGGVGAVVVPPAELMPAALKVHPGDLGVALYHPGGEGTGGGGEDDVEALPAEHLDNLVQLGKVVGFFVRLELGPGEDVDGGGVDAGLFEQADVFVPDVAGPLVGVIIAAVEDMGEGGLHGEAPFLGEIKVDAVSYMVHLSTMEDENPVFWLKVVWNLRRVVRFWLQPDRTASYLA